MSFRPARATAHQEGFAGRGEVRLLLALAFALALVLGALGRRAGSADADGEEHEPVEAREPASAVPGRAAWDAQSALAHDRRVEMRLLGKELVVLAVIGALLVLRVAFVR